MKMNQSEVRKALGYCGLFATRETVNEAMEYAHTIIADACGKNNKIGVVTAVGVFHNALIDHIVRNFDLVPKGEEEPVFIRTCPKSGTDFRLSDKYYDGAVYIDTPNGCVSIFVDTESKQTVVRAYDGGDGDDGEPNPEVVFMTKIWEKQP